MNFFCHTSSWCPTLFYCMPLFLTNGAFNCMLKHLICLVCSRSSLDCHKGLKNHKEAFMIKIIGHIFLVLFCLPLLLTFIENYSWSQFLMFFLQYCWTLSWNWIKFNDAVSLILYILVTCLNWACGNIFIMYLIIWVSFSNNL